MAENSGIQWTDHTFNPWRGCTKVSPGCAHCYAETLSGRNPGTLGVWGPSGTRVVAAESQWKLPLKWNREAEVEARFRTINGIPVERPRVFCASLADVFEDWQGPMLDSKKERYMVYKPNGGLLTTAPYAEEPGANCRWLTMSDVRARLFRLIDATPNLDWLLLTKRPENIAKMPLVGQLDGECVFPSDRLKTRPNVWLGTSVGHRSRLHCIDTLRAIPAAVRFLSVEPLLEELGTLDLTGIHWVIVGGESGSGSRPCNLAWIRNVVQQCRDQHVAVFVKQLGQTATDSIAIGVQQLRLRDKKGGDMAEWPEDLRIREFPRVSE